MSNTPDGQAYTQQVEKKVSTVSQRLRGLNRYLILGFVGSIVALVLTDFIPDAIGTFSSVWLRSTLDAIFSSFVVAFVIMLLFDFYDIKSEIEYMQNAIQTLLQMHQQDDQADRAHAQE
jgi:uncharacterized membrane protein YeaQ/YmgE (transglycosylase-associated protein family)